MTRLDVSTDCSDCEARIRAGVVDECIKIVSNTECTNNCKKLISCLECTVNSLEQLNGQKDDEETLLISEKDLDSRFKKHQEAWLNDLIWTFRCRSDDENRKGFTTDEIIEVLEVWKKCSTFGSLR